MKWKIEQKYLRVGLIALAVVLLGISFYYILEHGERIEETKSAVWNTMSPIVTGCIMAYLLNPILKFFERVIFTPAANLIFKGEDKEKTRKKFSRGAGVLCTAIFLLVLVVGVLYLVIPQVYLSLVKIVMDAPNYYNEVVSRINALNPEESEFSKYLLMGLDHGYSQAITYLNENILPNMDKIVASITSGIVGGVKVVINSILALIISVYVMTEKEMLISVGKKLTFSIFNRKNANSVLKGVRYANQVFGGFINGKIIDSFIIGAICYLFMVILGFDYAVLISIVIGVTNIIPYFGPFIGAIPSVLILLMINPKHGLIFAIFVIVLQQVDGNILGPIILGDRLKISSMWILFAILIGGGFFGVPGMILGAPCFACIYAFVGTVCRYELTKKDLPVKTEDYYAIGQIMEDGFVIMQGNVEEESKEEPEPARHAEQEKKTKDDEK